MSEIRRVRPPAPGWHLVRRREAVDVGSSDGWPLRRAGRESRILVHDDGREIVLDEEPRADH